MTTIKKDSHLLQSLVTGGKTVHKGPQAGFLMGMVDLAIADNTPSIQQVNAPSRNLPHITNYLETKKPGLYRSDANVSGYAFVYGDPNENVKKTFLDSLGISESQFQAHVQKQERRPNQNVMLHSPALNDEIAVNSIQLLFGTTLSAPNDSLAHLVSITSQSEVDIIKNEGFTGQSVNSTYDLPTQGGLDIDIIRLNLNSPSWQDYYPHFPNTPNEILDYHILSHEVAHGSIYQATNLPKIQVGKFKIGDNIIDPGNLHPERNNTRLAETHSDVHGAIETIKYMGENEYSKEQQQAFLMDLTNFNGNLPLVIANAGEPELNQVRVASPALAALVILHRSNPEQLLNLTDVQQNQLSEMLISATSNYSFHKTIARDVWSNEPEEVKDIFLSLSDVVDREIQRQLNGEGGVLDVDLLRETLKDNLNPEELKLVEGYLHPAENGPAHKGLESLSDEELANSRRFFAWAVQMTTPPLMESNVDKLLENNGAINEFGWNAAKTLKPTLDAFKQQREQAEQELTLESLEARTREYERKIPAPSWAR
jgi:hypothetical protein